MAKRRRLLEQLVATTAWVLALALVVGVLADPKSSADALGTLLGNFGAFFSGLIDFSARNVWVFLLAGLVWAAWSVWRDISILQHGSAPGAIRRAALRALRRSKRDTLAIESRTRGRKPPPRNEIVAQRFQEVEDAEAALEAARERLSEALEQYGDIEDEVQP